MNKRILFPLFLFCINVSATVDKKEIHQAIRSHIKEANECYEDRLKQKKVYGKITMNWEVNDKGIVVSAQVDKEQTTLKDKKFQTCLIEKSKTWKFPPAQKDQTFTITFPFVFSLQESTF